MYIYKCIYHYLQNLYYYLVVQLVGILAAGARGWKTPTLLLLLLLLLSLLLRLLLLLSLLLSSLLFFNIIIIIIIYMLYWSVTSMHWGIWLWLHRRYFQESPWFVLISSCLPAGWHSMFVFGIRAFSFGNNGWWDYSQIPTSRRGQGERSGSVWLRTNGVNTNGVTAKVLLFDGFDKALNMHQMHFLSKIILLQWPH